MKSILLLLVVSSIGLAQNSVHPPFDQTQRLSPTVAGSGDSVGNSVSISGDTAVIGARNSTVGQNQFQGVAYVYRRTNGQWIFQQRLVWDQGYSGVEFGTTVAIRGDTIMVGVPKAQVSGNSHQGRVVVFRRENSTWNFSQVLGASDGAPGDQFGLSLSISGDTAMIGANGDNVGSNADQGSVYVFARNQNGWFQRQKLTAPDGAASDNFGNVSISGETAVIGSFLASIGPNGSQGAAYVFTKNGQSWSFAQKITSSDGAPTDWFGSTVNIYGGTIVASAANADIGSSFNQGASYIFTKSGGIWTQRQKITVADEMIAKGFAVRTINSDYIVAQARRELTGPDYNKGLSYIFARSADGWEFQQRLEPLDSSRGDGFAYAAEIFANTILYGALFADDGPSLPDVGAAYMFEKSPSPVLIVSLAGRVTGRNGRGAFPARVSIEDSFGNIRYASTNPFGYYRFKDIPAGSENTLRVSSKRTVYDSRTVVVESGLTAFDFSPVP